MAAQTVSFMMLCLAYQVRLVYFGYPEVPYSLRQQYQVIYVLLPTPTLRVFEGALYTYSTLIPTPCVRMLTKLHPGVKMNLVQRCNNAICAYPNIEWMQFG
jgi:hypothetical protein